MGCRLQVPNKDTDISHLTPPEPFELSGIHLNPITKNYYIQVVGRVSRETEEKFKKMRELSSWANQVAIDNSWTQPNPLVQ
jgi:hypothetical protein